MAQQREMERCYQSKAMQSKKSLDEGSGRSLYAQSTIKAKANDLISEANDKTVKLGNVAVHMLAHVAAITNLI